MKKYCYFNDRIMEERKACISPFDLGVLRGYGIFDVMCTTNGKPFHLTDHWSSLVRGSKDLHLTLPVDLTTYKKIIAQLLAKSPYKNTSIRTVLTGGVSANGITLGEKPTFFILLHDMDQFTPPENLYTNGAKIITDNYMRSHVTNKTTSYIEAIKNQRSRNTKKAVEILYIYNDHVLECATSNIFIVSSHTLLTPSENIFPGVTRKIILSLARKNDIHTHERIITQKELLHADEVFITGSAKHILPITQIDTHKIGDGKPGPITKQLMQIYDTYRSQY